ncbi:MAG: transglycosylase domain-containing protein [Pseudomonadota bacterium]
MTATDPPEPGARRIPWRVIARRSLWGAIAAAIIALLMAAGYLALMLRAAPSATELKRAEAARASVLLTADGQPLATFNHQQQQHVTLDQVSPDLVKALVATEDARFFDHRGIDLRRTVAALLSTASGKVQGGSTITQQLARTLFPDQIGRERSIERKVKEMIAAVRLERHFTKKQILEAYLNNARFLYNVVGIEMAARTYCDKSAADLDLLESATLIGMLKGTAYYNPVLHPARSKERRNLVLAQMVRRGMLPDTEYRRLITLPLRVSLKLQSDKADAAPHFVARAREWLVDWAAEHNYNLYTDGLVVHTTLDARLQEAATRAVERQGAALQAVADVEWAQAGSRVSATTPEPYVAARSKVTPFAHLWKARPELLATFVRETAAFRKAAAASSDDDAVLQRLLADAEWLEQLKRDKTRLEAGFVAIDPSNGEVRAWVGSRDFDVDQYDHVSQAERQPGSTFKAFVYGAALESGIGPDRTYQDGAVELALGDGKVWRPTDMRGATDQPMTLRDGLVYSKNTITVQVSQEVGVARVAALAKAMGVDQSRLDPVPSLALGTSPVTLAEMVNAYATVAHQGERVQPVLIKRITDRHGTVVAMPIGATRRAMSRENAVELLDMMRGVVARGTGTLVRSRFGIDADVAGKTGTTQNNTDGWFMLMHPQLVAGAWVGFNDARVAMRSSHWGQGGHNAVLLVGEFFRDALQGGALDPKATFPPSRRPPPERQEMPPQPADEENGGYAATTDPPVSVPAMGRAPAEMNQARSGAAPLISDRAGSPAISPDDAPPKSAAEIERVVDLINGRAPAGFRAGPASEPAPAPRTENAAEPEPAVELPR